MRCAQGLSDMPASPPDGPLGVRDSSSAAAAQGVAARARVRLLQKLGAEAMGAFALVFVGCGAIVTDERHGGIVTHVGVALAFGFAIAVMIHAVGHVSGAHFNPAVTVAFAALGRFPWRHVPPYVGSQVVGAVGAALALRLIHGAETGLGMTLPRGAAAPALAMEVVLTALLMFVIAAVATDARAVGELAGIAIGGTVAMAALAGGPVSGASLNPARSLGPALAAGVLDRQWLYVLGPVGGALLGGFAYRLVRCSTEDERPAGGCC